MTGSDPISDAIIAGSASGELGDSINASKRAKRDRFSAFEAPNPPDQCSNCSTELSGPVCHSCGQTADTFHRPIWDLLVDILDGLFGLEGRLWRTIPPLMLRPGHITQNYLSGVRARYVMPFRLYLTVSVVFFLLIFAFDGFGGDEVSGTVPTPEAPVAAANLETLDERLAEAGIPESEREALARTAQAGVAQVVSRSTMTPEQRAQQRREDRDSMKQEFRQMLLPEVYGEASDPTLNGAGDDGVNINVTGLDELPLEVREAMVLRIDRIIDSGGATLVASMQRWAPTMMFFLLPLYALMLALTHFYKRGYFFYDHLVVSLHFHAFMLLLITGLSLITYVIPAAASYAVLFGLVWSNWYLYRLHRTVYSHGRFSSLLRVILLDFVYAIFLSFALLGLFIVGVMTT